MLDESLASAPRRDIEGRADAYLEDVLAFFASIGRGAVPSPDAEVVASAVHNGGANLGEVLSGALGREADRLAVVVGAAFALSVLASDTSGVFDKVVFGFWDSALTDFRAGKESRDRDAALLDAVFAALLFQLFQGRKVCQLSALHGFNHLRHPQTATVVDAWLTTVGDDELRRYAAAAKRFEAL